MLEEKRIGCDCWKTSVGEKKTTCVFDVYFDTSLQAFDLLIISYLHKDTWLIWHIMFKENVLYYCMFWERWDLRFLYPKQSE